MSTDSAQRARAAIEESILTQRALLEEGPFQALLQVTELVVSAMRDGGKLLLFGNGGSASDASHIAAEFVGRFVAERRALPALSLCTDESAVTAIANDYGYDRVFARQMQALGREGDVAVGISTSGRSPNVLAGIRAARELGLTTVGMTGRSGRELAGAVDVCLTVPSDVTARIQEGHILIAHVLCDLVEQRFL